MERHWAKATVCSSAFRGRESENIVQSRAPVDLVQDRAGGIVAGKSAAGRQQPVIVAEVVEKLVTVADIEIEAAEFIVESVELARRADEVVVGAVRISRKVRQIDEAEDVLGDGADLRGGDDIAGERLSRHARA